MNKVILIGRTTKDIELKSTQSGLSVANFTLAVKRDYIAKESDVDVDYINCIVWRKQAELLDKYVKKGHKILVEGSLQVRSYTDKDGNNRYITEVLVDRIEFLENRTSSEAPKQEHDTVIEEPQSDPFKSEFEPKGNDDDLPF